MEAEEEAEQAPRSPGAGAAYPRAVSIPIQDLPDRLAELPADVEVVAYCRGAYCAFAHEAVRLLARRGRQAVRLSDGMLEWQLARQPVATAASAGVAQG